MALRTHPDGRGRKAILFTQLLFTLLQLWEMARLAVLKHTSIPATI